MAKTALILLLAATLAVGFYKELKYYFRNLPRVVREQLDPGADRYPDYHARYREGLR